MGKLTEEDLKGITHDSLRSVLMDMAKKIEDLEAKVYDLKEEEVVLSTL